MLGLWSCARAPNIDGHPPAPTALRSGHATVIRLQPYQGRLRAMQARAADREWLLLFDTGGGTTVISPALAQALGCAPRGSVTGYRMSGDPITMPTCAEGALVLDDWRAPSQTLAIFDVMTLLPRGWPRVDGVIALRSFAGHRLTLDLAANAVMVHDTRAASVDALRADAKRLLGRLATGPSGAELLAFAGMVAGADTLWLEVDSGNLDAVLLAPHTARLLGVSDSVGAQHRDLALPLVPGQPATVLARVRTLIFDGALNAAWLEQGRLTIDLVDGSLWWEAHTH